MRARDVIGKTISSITQERVRIYGGGGFCHSVSRIEFEDGSWLRLSGVEIEGPDIGVECFFRSRPSDIQESISR